MILSDPKRGNEPGRASVRSGRRCLSLAAGILALAVAGACVPTTPITPFSGPYGGATNDPATCAEPANLWKGRFSARPNTVLGEGDGTGRSLVACFPDERTCLTWLGRAIGSFHGVIMLQSCTRRTDGAHPS